MSDLCKEFNKALSNTQKQTVPWTRDTLTCNSVSNSNQELIQQQLEKKNIFKFENRLTKAQKWSMITKRERVFEKKIGTCQNIL